MTCPCGCGCEDFRLRDPEFWYVRVWQLGPAHTAWWQGHDELWRRSFGFQSMVMGAYCEHIWWLLGRDVRRWLDKLMEALR